jgi:hypothetical protein
MTILSDLFRVLDRRALRSALSGYPEFLPPHLAAPDELSTDQARDNFEYMLATKSDRIANLSRLMREFNIDLTLSNSFRNTFGPIARWVNRYGDQLVVLAPHSHSLVWDISISYGEALVMAFSQSRWILFSDHRSSEKDSAHNFPCVIWGKERICPYVEITTTCKNLLIDYRSEGGDSEKKLRRRLEFLDGPFVWKQCQEEAGGQ